MNSLVRLSLLEEGRKWSAMYGCSRNKLRHDIVSKTESECELSSDLSFVYFHLSEGAKDHSRLNYNATSFDLQLKLHPSIVRLHVRKQCRVKVQRR